MKKKEIQAEYKKKIRLLKKYDELYYVKSKPAVNDHEYDKLKEQILLLESKYDFLD